MPKYIEAALTSILIHFSFSSVSSVKDSTRHTRRHCFASLGFLHRAFALHQKTAGISSLSTPPIDPPTSPPRHPHPPPPIVRSPHYSIRAKADSQIFLKTQTDTGEGEEGEKKTATTHHFVVIRIRWPRKSAHVADSACDEKTTTGGHHRTQRRTRSCLLLQGLPRWVAPK